MIVIEIAKCSPINFKKHIQVTKNGNFESHTGSLRAEGDEELPCCNDVILIRDAMSTQPSRAHVAVEPKRFEQTLSFFPIPDISSKWTGSPRKSNELSPLAKTSCTQMDSQSVLPPLKAVHKKPVGLTKGNYLNSFNLHPGI